MHTISERVRSNLPTYYGKLRQGIDTALKLLLALALLMSVGMFMKGLSLGVTELLVLLVPMAFYVVVMLCVRALLLLLVDIADALTELRLEARKRNPDL